MNGCAYNNFEGGVPVYKSYYGETLYYAGEFYIQFIYIIFIIFILKMMWGFFSRMFLDI